MQQRVCLSDKEIRSASNEDDEEHEKNDEDQKKNNEEQKKNNEEKSDSELLSHEESSSSGCDDW